MTGYETGKMSNETEENKEDKSNDEFVRGSQEWFDELDPLEKFAGGALAVPERLVLYEAAKRALQNAFLRTATQEAVGNLGFPYDACASVQANLLDGVPFDDFRKSFDDGKGKELHGDDRCPPKMAAIYSSSALVVNNFGPWYGDPDQLLIKEHEGFKQIAFEAQLPTGLGGTPPHLDVCLDSDNEILAIESKCLEYLTTKPADFRPAYDTIRDTRRQSSWFRHITVLRDNRLHYRYLDAAQLIKHYLGLSHSRPGRSITLLYLFWEPRNWQEFKAFRQHREEIRAFSDVVAGDQIRFEAMSYNELWAEWEPRTAPAWLADHLKRLIARYQVDLSVI
jgi:hypothetical protein